MSDPRYSYWRVWHEGHRIRVARDRHWHTAEGPDLQPQHLAQTILHPEGIGYELHWKNHEQGGEIASVDVADFARWLRGESS